MNIQSKIFFTATSALLLLFSAQALAASEPCQELEPEQDNCTAIGGAQVTTWQASIEANEGNPPWREISIDDENAVVDIAFDPTALNSGLLRIPESGGVYDSEEDYIAMRDLLYGIDVQDYEEDGYAIHTIVTSSHQKVYVDESEEYIEPVPNSRSFIHDALSDLEGNIEVGNEQYAMGLFFDMGDCADFSAGNWSACFRPQHRKPVWLFVSRRIWTEIDDFEINGESTSTHCDQFLGFLWNINCETRRVEADEMQIRNEWLQTTLFSGLVWTGRQSTPLIEDTDGIELGKTRRDLDLGNDLRGVCGIGFVKSGAYATTSPDIDVAIGSIDPNEIDNACSI